MAEHRWSILCTSAPVDDQNNLTLAGIIDEMQVAGDLNPPQVVLIPHQLTLVTVWRRSNPEVGEKFPMRIRFVAPDNTSVHTADAVEVDLSVFVQSRVMGRLGGFPFKGVGTYRCLIETRPDANSEWTAIDSVPVAVYAAQPLSVPPAP